MNIIELAKQVGLTVGTNISGVTLVGSPSTHGLAHISIDEMERFADLVLEAAAKVCEDQQVDADETGIAEDRAYNTATKHCAKAIRALKGAKE